jgi:1-aminocyclopropane-1-carboxylate deaminase/D-cysteine desulfhydrase-like pyridoxal-dependent ACC family enzyme
MHIEKLPPFRLAQLPTPIEKLARLSRELGGPELLIKRDETVLFWHTGGAPALFASARELL